jgi:hypothetical protein
MNDDPADIELDDITTKAMYAVINIIGDESPAGVAQTTMRLFCRQYIALVLESRTYKAEQLIEFIEEFDRFRNSPGEAVVTPSKE